MKLCDTCIYHNQDEYHKPCIVYRNDCEFYEKERGDMTREKAIDLLDNLIGMIEDNHNSDYDTAFRMAIKALEQEPCGDEYIKVPKNALKYRTAGMVAYNVEWLKNHFDIERAVICGEQEPCDDAISRQAVQDYIAKYLSQYLYEDVRQAVEAIDEFIGELPPVTPQPKTDKENIHREREQAYMQGYEDACKKYRQEPKWIPVSERLPEDEEYVLVCYADGSIRTAYYYIDTESYPPEFRDCCETGWYDYNENFIYQDVVAWMPLPKPYKAESEDKQ